MMESKPIHVTDHAVVRYFERVLGVDVDLIRKELSSPTVQLADRIGAPFVILKSGHRAAIRDGCVQTILPKRERRRTL